MIQFNLLFSYSFSFFFRDCEENLTPNAQGYVDTMLSFLSSLSDKTFGLRCHPGALFFKRHFNRTKASLARHLYYIYNEHVFDKKLPDDMPIKWSKKLTSSCGITTTKVDINPDTNSKRYLAYITLSKKIITTAERLRDTMLHEMCHAAVWLINRSTDSHGPIWKLWIGRSRPSEKLLDKCVCGYCGGKFKEERAKNDSSSFSG
uniref:SprT-like domain-containing protein n=1 Tax=Rhodnius prolixus TaxID=13249 RepID=T1HYU0_RHOPR